MIWRGFYDWASFSAQQSAENALKAIFQKIGAEVWGPSLVALLQELKKHKSVPEELIEWAMELDKAYVASRYPNVHPSGAPRNRYSQNEARRLIGYAKRIYEFCSGILSEMD